MEFLRKSAISAACFILFMCLTFLGTALAVRAVIGQPAPLENALNQTDTYTAIVTNFIQSNKDTSTIGVPLSIPAIQDAVQQAFPKSVVQPAVDELISGVYAWAQGKTSTLTFRIDLSSAKVALADNVQQAVEQQAGKLPVCSYSQLLANPQIAYQNPLTVTCLPPGISSTIIGNYAKQAVLNSSFLKNPILTPASMHLVSGNQLTLPSQQSGSTHTVLLPTLYHRMIEGIYLTVALSIICLGLIIWLHRDHARGLSRAGAALAWAGIICIVDALIAGSIPHWLNTNNRLGSVSGQQITNSLEQKLLKVVAILAEAFHHWLLWYGIILCVAGLGTWLGVTVIRRKKQKTEPPILETPTPTPSDNLAAIS